MQAPNQPIIFKSNKFIFHSDSNNNNTSNNGNNTNSTNHAAAATTTTSNSLLGDSASNLDGKFSK